MYQKQEQMFNYQCDQRKSVSPPDPCVDFSFVQISCPAGNMFPYRSVGQDDGAYPMLKCRTCGIKPLEPDASPYRGRWAGKVSWGPNQFLGTISETEIQSYLLYITDAMYQKLGRPLASEEVQLWSTLTATCCDTSFYSADLDIELPVNYTYFMVVPVTIAGLELNVGVVSDRIKDVGTHLMTASGSRRGSTVCWQSLLSFAALVAAMLSLPLAR